MATKHKAAPLSEFAPVRAMIWGFAAVVDGSLSGVEFVLRRIQEAVEDGSLRPSTAAQVAEEARRLLQLDNTK